MEYIYSRVSTAKQTTEGQLLKLRKKFPDATVIEETESGAKRRPILEALLSDLEAGDTLIVYSLDRLGRRALATLKILEDLIARDINFISLREGADYSTPVGRLVTQILISVAEMEREFIIERTLAGMAAAKNKGRIGGRPKEISNETIEQAIMDVRAGMTIPKAAAKAGFSGTHLRNLIKKRKK